ncbi:hypothetical protein BKA57DRAFT_436826 [Linnemannia elongata]|nr:hypothetical protein BKA57DRAFT_436826 [Linnemannia elongata]
MTSTFKPTKLIFLTFAMVMALVVSSTQQADAASTCQFFNGRRRKLFLGTSVIPKIIANSILTTLYSEGDSIGEDGFQALLGALKTNSTLTTLNLILNSIGDSGAQVLAEALKTNSILTFLDLQNNSIGPNGAQALFEARNTNLTLILFIL